nr:reverse transcriptase domain-containing protein [Tanacetum cinerariifolium]
MKLHEGLFPFDIRRPSSGLKLPGGAVSRDTDFISGLAMRRAANAVDLMVINDLKKCGYKKDKCELNYKFLNNLQPEWKHYGTLLRITKNLMDINIDALNGDQPLPVIAQVSLAGTAQNAPPTLKDPYFWTAKEKKTRKIDRLVRSLLIQGLPNDIYSLIDSNETAKDLWDALERQMRGSKYGEQDRKAAILYEYETFKAIEGEQLLDTYLLYIQVINDLKKCSYKKDKCELNYKFLNNLQPEWKHDVVCL